MKNGEKHGGVAANISKRNRGINVISGASAKIMAAKCVAARRKASAWWRQHRSGVSVISVCSGGMAYGENHSVASSKRHGVWRSNINKHGGSNNGNQRSSGVAAASNVATLA